MIELPEMDFYHHAVIPLGPVEIKPGQWGMKFRNSWGDIPPVPTVATGTDEGERRDALARVASLILYPGSRLTQALNLRGF